MDDIRTANTAWCDALNAHDPDAVARCFSEDGVFDNAGQRQEGRGAIRESTAQWLAAIGEFHIEERSFLSSGGAYAKEWTMTGVHVGDMPGLPATGKSFSVQGAGTGEVRDGLIVRATLYWNFADFLAQIGALPAPVG